MPLARLNLVWVICFVWSCNSSHSEQKILLQDQFQFPRYLGIVEVPKDNPLIESSIELGRRLFYTTELSANGSIACVSCHIPNKAFADTNAFSLGIHGRLTMRNSPSLANVAYQPYLHADGGVTSLETQVLAPLQDTFEMGIDIHKVAEKLRQDTILNNLSIKAYSRPIDHYVIVRALASFERTLLSYNSPYDLYSRGNLNALNDSEENGMRLFMSDRLKCTKCHSGKNFTNYTFQNNGMFNSVGQDSGRVRITFNPNERYHYKVPSLRNIAVTGPYMHNGAFKSLDSIIISYAKGGVNSKEKSNLISGFDITLKERKDLKAFLFALTDTVFLTNNTYKE